MVDSPAGAETIPPGAPGVGRVTAGNITITPVVPVHLVPAHELTLSAGRAEAEVDQRLALRAVLTTSGTLNEVVLTQMLPSAIITDVIAGAGSGETQVGEPDPGSTTLRWRRDLAARRLVTVAVEGTLAAAGTLTQTAAVFWDWGFVAESPPVAISADPAGVPRPVYLPLVLCH